LVTEFGQIETILLQFDKLYVLRFVLQLGFKKPPDKSVEGVNPEFTLMDFTANQ